MERLEPRFEDMPRIIDPRRLSETAGLFPDMQQSDMTVWWKKKSNCLYAQSIGHPELVAVAYVYPELGSTMEYMRRELSAFINGLIADQNALQQEQESGSAPDPVDSPKDIQHSVAA